MAKVAAAQRRPLEAGCGSLSKKQRAARITAMGLEDEALRRIRRAVTALAAKADAETRQKAHELEVLRAGKDITENTYRVVIAIGQMEAMRQTRSLDSGHTLPDFLSMKKFYDYTAETLQKDPTLQTDKWKFRTYANNAAKFWKLLEYLKDVVEHTGATLAADAFDKANWSKVGCSQFAEPSTLAFVLAPDFEAAFFGALKKTGKNVTDLENKVTGYVKPKPKAKAPAKKPRRGSKKAAPAPAETTSENELDEEATEKAPKAKAAARRARKKATEPVETTTTTATTPTNDGLITALKERVSSLERELDAHKTTFEVREANSKSKISALESKLESSEAELAACKEQIKEKEDEIFNLALVVEPLKTQLAEVKNELARVKDEIAREKDKNKAGRRQTAVSPLCDATNV